MVSARKPAKTYKSPAPTDSPLITIHFPHNLAHKPSPSPLPSSSPSSPAPPSNVSISALSSPTAYTPCYRPISPPLPLFHPLGPLALSLPPLDPSEYGLPPLPVPDTLTEKTQAKPRRSATKARDTEDTPSSVHPASSTTRDPKDKASPRKRRFGTRRKRKDPDDGDATYPAKRTRVSRTTANHREATHDESPPDAGRSELDYIATSDVMEKRKRRPARSRNHPKRNDSSASETSLSPPPSMIQQAAADPQEAHDPEPASIPSPVPVPVPVPAPPKDMTKSDEPADHDQSGVEDDEREEGEISEEHPNP